MSAVGPGRQHVTETKEVVHHHWSYNDYPSGEMHHNENLESDSDDDEKSKPTK